jgi:hypothetical protein
VTKYQHWFRRRVARAGEPIRLQNWALANQAVSIHVKSRCHPKRRSVGHHRQFLKIQKIKMM